MRIYVEKARIESYTTTIVPTANAVAIAQKQSVFSLFWLCLIRLENASEGNRAKTSQKNRSVAPTNRAVPSSIMPSYRYTSPVRQRNKKNNVSGVISEQKIANTPRRNSKTFFILFPLPNSCINLAECM